MGTKQARGGELVRNLARSAGDPVRRREMLRKVWLRAAARARREDPQAARAWAAARAVEPAALLRSLDADLWDEAEAFHRRFHDEAEATLAPIGVDLGGGGDYRLLYFLVRHLRPRSVVETGVAAGFSSAAVLEAMDRNDLGRLWSSDFPYFRLEDPERFIGVLVPEDRRGRWSLHIEGDRTNLPAILAEAGAIDLFHYDSDKSVEGRAYAVRTVLPRLAPTGVVVFDDIQDNFHFRDHLAATGATGHVFEFGGKYVGLIATGGPLAEHLAADRAS